MDENYAMTPNQAIETVQAASVDDPMRLIRDHTAAGRVRSYAHVQLVIEADGTRTSRLGAAIAPEVWERMIREGVDGDAWGGGTVRLAGSDLIGGEPAMHIAGVVFHPADIRRLAFQQQPTPQPLPVGKRSTPTKAIDAVKEAEAVAAPKRRKRVKPDLSGLHTGALQLTVQETEAALSLSHTTIYKLLKRGVLQRAPGQAGTRVTTASVRRYAGLGG